MTDGDKNVDKHKRYKTKYGKNELYWGIGIENEMYLEFENKALVSSLFFKNNHKPERYSVNYYNIYKDGHVSNAFNHFMDHKEDIEVPIIINSHSFMHTDTENNHKTTYERKPKPNQKFKGETIHEFLKKTNDYFEKMYDIQFVYDGDTIEFITQNFYNTTITSIINELNTIKTMFEEQIQPIFPYQKEFGKVRIMKENHPFAIHLTNLTNISMFNNGTFHFNFTLPTKLDEEGKIENDYLFVKQHRNAIRILQLFEPLFITVYGSHDPFCTTSQSFSASSQRCAVSRYIGIGSYDTEKMEKGKVLTMKTDQCHDQFWYHTYHEKHSSYKKLEEIGLDINFNKHYYHGIEFRIFDYFPDHLLPELMECIVHLLDHSLEYNIPDIVKTKEWNELVINCMLSGKKAYIPYSQSQLFNVCNIPMKKNMNIIDFYHHLRTELKQRYGTTGKCSRHMLDHVYEIDTKMKHCCILN